MNTRTDLGTCNEGISKATSSCSPISSNKYLSMFENTDAEREVGFNTKVPLPILEDEGKVRHSSLSHYDENMSDNLETSSSITDKEFLNKPSSKSDSGDVLFNSDNTNLLEGVNLCNKPENYLTEIVTEYYKSRTTDSSDIFDDKAFDRDVYCKKKNIAATFPEFQDSNEGALDFDESATLSYHHDSTNFVSDQKAHEATSTKKLVQIQKLNVGDFFNTLSKEDFFHENEFRGGSDTDDKGVELVNVWDKIEANTQTEESDKLFANLNCTVSEPEIATFVDSSFYSYEDIYRLKLDIKLHEDSDDSETPVNSDDTDTPVNSDDNEEYKRSTEINSNNDDNPDIPKRIEFNSLDELSCSREDNNSLCQNASRSGSNVTGYLQNNSHNMSRNSDPESPRDSDPESPRDSDPESPRDSDPESPRDSDPESPRDSDPDIGSSVSEDDSASESFSDVTQNSDRESLRNSDPEIGASDPKDDSTSESFSDGTSESFSDGSSESFSDVVTNESFSDVISVLFSDCSSQPLRYGNSGKSETNNEILNKHNTAKVQQSYIDSQSNLITDNLHLLLDHNTTQGDKLENWFELGKSPLEVLKCFKEKCNSLIVAFQTYINYFTSNTEIKFLSDDIMGDKKFNKSVNSDEEEILSSCLGNGDKLNSKTLNFSSDSLRDITNFRTLFLHLRATAGTDITADLVKKNINGQMVLELYSGFYELRTIECNSLKEIEKAIRVDLVTFQSISLRSFNICSRIKILLPKQAQTIEELEVLNKDLKSLGGEVAEHISTIDELLKNISDSVSQYRFQSDLISEDLAEFLNGDFPDIFN